MRINLKAIGLALVAAFVMSAIGASTASAEVTVGAITSADGGAMTLTGEDVGAVGANSFTAFGNTVTCPESTYTGHKTKTATETTTSQTHELLPNKATSVTVTPHYKQVKAGPTANCDVSGGLSTTITMNGCDYDFDDFTPITANKLYSFTADLVCPHGVSGVTMHIYAGHGHGFQVCTVSIPAQNGLTGFEAENVEGGVELSGGTEGITASQSGLCGSAEESGAEYNVSVLVTGDDELGEPVGISISDETKTS